jgi:hypothetical protein
MGHRRPSRRWLQRRGQDRSVINRLQPTPPGPRRGTDRSTGSPSGVRRPAGSRSPLVLLYRLRRVRSVLALPDPRGPTRNATTSPRSFGRPHPFAPPQLIAPRLVFVLRSGVRRPRPFLYPIRESVFEIRSGNTAEAKVWASLGKTNTLMWGRRVPGRRSTTCRDQYRTIHRSSRARPTRALPLIREVHPEDRPGTRHS